MARLDFHAADGVPIAVHFTPSYPGRSSRLWITAPGYAQQQATRSMRALRDRLAESGDVAMVDFRGTGASGGRFSFGAWEFRDLLPVLDWARSRYPQRDLLAFSLGTYSGLRAALAAPDGFTNLCLVSAFGWPMEILLSPTWLVHHALAPFRHIRYAVRPEHRPGFRWGPLGDPKPDLRSLCPALPVPCRFLSGGRDWLVPARVSRRLHEAVAAPKTWTLFPSGLHAEHMFLQDPEGFLRWAAPPKAET